MFNGQQQILHAYSELVRHSESDRLHTLYLMISLMEDISAYTDKLFWLRRLRNQYAVTPNAACLAKKVADTFFNIMNFGLNLIMF